MSRVLGILKDQPLTENIYLVTKRTDPYSEGDILYIDDNVYDSCVKGKPLEENIRQIGTFRRAFIGDMQEKLNIAAGGINLKEHFAETVHCNSNGETYPLYNKFTYAKIGDIPKKSKWNFKVVLNKLLSKFKKKKEEPEDLYLEQQLFGPKL